MPTEHAVYKTTERCFQCGTEVVRIDPPFEGNWQYYCDPCQAMVTTVKDFEKRILEPLKEGEIGRVVAWPLKERLQIEPVESEA